MTQLRDETAILVLLGLTAGTGKRRSLRRFLDAHVNRPVFIPDIPFSRSLSDCARWLRGYVTDEVLSRGHAQVDILAYIGGGAVLRTMAQDGCPLRIRRIVYDRGPIQEKASARLGRIVPAPLLIAAGFRMVLDLSRGDWHGLPFPPAEAEQGLIVELDRSRLSRWLCVRRADVPPSAWEAETLLPGAHSTLTLGLSHDQVYDDPAFLSQALAFIETGQFRPEGS